MKKKCYKCKTEKDLSEFNKNRREKDGLQSQCKLCTKAYYEANKEKIAARSKAYYEANKEKIAAKDKAYYEANKEKIAAKDKAYREANKEKIAAKDKAYYEANKEKVAAKDKAYREANKEKIAARSKAYYEANKGSKNRKTKENADWKQKITSQVATKSGRYTQEEEEIIQTFDGTIFELALLLGRSYNPVKSKKTKLRRKGEIC